MLPTRFIPWSGLCSVSVFTQTTKQLLAFVCVYLLWPAVLPMWAVLQSPSGCVMFWPFLWHPLVLFFSSHWLVGEDSCEAVFNLERLWERDIFCSWSFLVLLHCCLQLLHRECHRKASCLLIWMSLSVNKGCQKQGLDKMALHWLWGKHCWVCLPWPSVRMILQKQLGSDGKVCDSVETLLRIQGCVV